MKPSSCVLRNTILLLFFITYRLVILACLKLLYSHTFPRFISGSQSSPSEFSLKYSAMPLTNLLLYNKWCKNELSALISIYRIEKSQVWGVERLGGGGHKIGELTRLNGQTHFYGTATRYMFNFFGQDVIV